MKSKRFIILLICCMTAAGFTSSCIQSKKRNDNSSEQKLSLNIYSGTTEEHANAVIKAFQKETGIQTNFIRLSGGEILARIRAEKGSPKASVWFGGPADTFVTAKNEGLLQKYVSINASKIPTQYKDKDGYWTGIYKGYIGFICNGRLLKDKNLAVPKSWEDLLKPEYKKQIVIANPSTSSGTYLALSTLAQMWGEDKALDYFKKLDANVKEYPTSSLAAIQMPALGEAMIGLGFLYDGIDYIEKGYKDVILSAPSEGTGCETGAVAIIKNGPNVGAAQKFVDWCLTKEAQEIGQTAGEYQFLTNPDAKAPKEAEELKNIKVIDYDLKFAGSKRSELLKGWHKVTVK